MICVPRRRRLEMTPERWEKIKAMLRELPSADSLSRSANSLEKEATVSRWWRVPLHPMTRPNL
jgi:hypothetical protein